MLTYRFNLLLTLLKKTQSCQRQYQLLSAHQLEDKGTEDFIQHIFLFLIDSQFVETYTQVLNHTH